MTEADRIKFLRIALIVIGLVFIFGLWPLTMIWPSGWAWHAEGRSYYGDDSRHLRHTGRFPHTRRP